MKLITSLYKIIAKVLLAHLRAVLDETIAQAQGALVNAC
jgi:hypothetical protein